MDWRDLAQLDFLDAQIANLTEAIAGSKSPFEKPGELLCPIPVATTSPPVGDASAPRTSTSPPIALYLDPAATIRSARRRKAFGPRRRSHTASSADVGGDYFRTPDPERITKRLLAELEGLGHRVTLELLPEGGWPQRLRIRFQGYGVNRSHFCSPPPILANDSVAISATPVG